MYMRTLVIMGHCGNYAQIMLGQMSQDPLNTLLSCFGGVFGKC